MNAAPKRMRGPRAIAAGAAAALALLVLAMIAQILSERAAAVEAAERGAAGLARAWEDQATTAIDALAHVLEDAERLIARGGGAWARESPALGDASPLIRAIAIVDEQGLVRETTVEDLRDRRLLSGATLARLRDGRADVIDIGPPIGGRLIASPTAHSGGHWHFRVARPIFDDAGAFTGASVAMVNPAHLIDAATALDLGGRGDAWLLRIDGQPLLRASRTRRPSPTAAETPAFIEIAAAIDVANRGVVRAGDPQRIIAYRSTTLLPVIAAVEIDLDAWLASWRGRAWTFGSVTVGLAAIALILFALLANETRKAAAATERQHLLGAAIENTSSPVLITDSAGNLVWVNAAFSTLTGYGLGEVIGRNPRLLKSGDVPDQRYADMWDAINAGRSWRGDFVNRAKNGARFEVEQTITPVQDATGRIRYFVSIQNDVTREKAALRALIDAKREADEATRAKSQFLANMSHELRTPLNAIIGFSQMMRTQVFGPLGDPRYDGYVADIETAADHLLGLISDLLDLSRIEVGKMELREEMKRPRDIFEACRHVLGHKALASGVAIENALSPDAPMLWIDLLRVRQVIINLVYNSLKFTHRGGLIRVTGRRTLDGGFEISVADNGAGIAKADIETILDPFVTRSLTRAPQQEQGTGLGLHLSRAIMRAHGGDLRIESDLGKGTIVVLAFPASRVIDPDEG